MAARMREVKAQRRAQELARRVGALGTVRSRRTGPGRGDLNVGRVFEAAYKAVAVADEWVRRCRACAAWAFLRGQLVFLQGLVSRAEEEKLCLVATRRSWDETSQHFTLTLPKGGGEPEAQRPGVQGKYSVLVPQLQMILHWEASTSKPVSVKVVLPPVLVGGGTAAAIWQGIHAPAYAHEVWKVHAQLVKAAKYAITTVEVDSASANESVIAGCRLHQSGAGQPPGPWGAPLEGTPLAP